MTILVTGGSGLVGARLLPRLASAGLDCRALLRAGKPAPSGVTAVEADLLDPASLGPAVAGVSAIVHLAAVFRTPDTELIWKSNLEGTRNLIAAAEQHAPAPASSWPAPPTSTTPIPRAPAARTTMPPPSRPIPPASSPLKTCCAPVA